MLHQGRIALDGPVAEVVDTPLVREIYTVVRRPPTTGGLQPSVVDRLAEVLATTRRERGTAMLVVEQHLPFVLGPADRFAVFKRGEVVDAGAVEAGSVARIDEHTRLSAQVASDRRALRRASSSPRLPLHDARTCFIRRRTN